MTNPVLFHGFPTSPIILCAFSFIAGSLSAFSMAPYHLWPVLFLGLSTLYILLSLAQNKKSAFAYGWLFGFGYFLFSLYWISNALLVEGNPYSWAWPIAVAGLPAFLALFYGLACLLTHRFSNLKSLAGFLAFTAFIAGFEWLRGHILTGFPWNLFGYIWSDHLKMIQILSASNIYYLTWFTIIWATFVGFLLISQHSKKQKVTITILSLLSITLCYGYGSFRLSNTPESLNEDIAIRLIQANIAQEDKWKPDQMMDHFLKHIDLSKPKENTNAKTTFIVWPETALTYKFLENKYIQTQIKDLLRSHSSKAYILTGFLTREDDQYFNAVALIDKNADILNLYKKSHLVPFGEYIPFENWIPLSPIVQFSGFGHGPGPTTQKTPEYIKYSAMVCYEIIFSGNVINPQSRPDFIVNVTNDAWYGDSPGPYQHYTKAVFRAVEEGIPVLRAANTGISGIIDPLGRSLAKSQVFESATISASLPKPLQSVQRSKYTENTIFVVLLLITIALGHIQRIRN